MDRQVGQPWMPAILVGKDEPVRRETASRSPGAGRRTQVRGRVLPNSMRSPDTELPSPVPACRSHGRSRPARSSCRPFSAESSTATCCPKVGEPARMSTATSRMRPRTTRTSLSWAKGWLWKCRPRSVPTSCDSEWLICTKSRSIPCFGKAPAVPDFREEAARIADAARRDDLHVGNVRGFDCQH